MALNRRRFLGFLTMGGLVVTGCMGADSQTTESPTDTRSTAAGAEPDTTATASEDSIDMTGSRFEPVRTSVDPGTTVTWRNRDGVDHTVTSAQFHDAAAEWTVDERAGSDETVTYTFEEAGIYEYYCTIHGQETMCGVVLVGDVTLDATLPCESDEGDGIDY